MVDELLGVGGLELLLGEDVGVTDGDGAGGNGGQAGAGTVAGTGNGNVGVLVHELLSCSLDERLERGCSVVGHLTGKGGSGGVLSGTSGGSRGVATTGKTETGESGDATGETEELTTRAVIFEHGSPSENERRRGWGARCGAAPCRPSALRLSKISFVHGRNERVCRSLLAFDQALPCSNHRFTASLQKRGADNADAPTALFPARSGHSAIIS